MAKSQSSQYFLERAGLMPTNRAPAPIFHAARSLLHTETLEPPLPIVETLINGEPPPDRVGTEDPWPHGNCPDEEEA